jgi:hypothetical protein
MFAIESQHGQALRVWVDRRRRDGGSS